ncbi:MAG TPA: methyl-accepting chemotaxis protein [Spirochaetota bacterium]|nr:methyl-accepting chemotaxis protein [Spirochaetota bacterium]
MKSIKTKLILLIVGALFLVSIAFGIVSYTQSKNILLAQTEQSYLELTGEVSRVIQNSMRVNIAVVETLAERRIIDDDTPWPEKVSFLAKEAKRTGFDIFAIADTQGNSTRFNLERAAAKISDRNYYIRAMSGISTYSEVFVSRVSGLPSVSVAVPIKRNGKITGVLYGIRDGNEISHIVENIKIGETGYVYVVDKTGTIQGHKNNKLVTDMYNPIKASAEDKTLIPLANLIKRANTGEKGAAQYFFNGKDIFSSFAPIQDTDGWSVCVALEVKELLSRINYLRNIIIFITVSLLILGGILAYFIGKSIANPIIATVKYAEKMAELDLSSDVSEKYCERRDEIGTLAKAFQTLIGILRTTVIDIIKSAQQVATATDQIGQDNQNLSQRTTEQASALEEIASTIEEANASTRQNSENASEANNVATSSLKLAEDGGTVVEEAVLSIGEINASSSKIADIINMINEIAFQTNLLALNAAVEAARAGEQGRGFAVVAGEVRNLAQRAGSAAKEIDMLIKDSVDKIETGTELVNKSGVALKEIIEAIKKVTMLVSEMAASSDEQRRGIEQINTAIIDMDTMTQQNAALVEETAAASEEMSAQARELLAMIKRFNVGDSADRIIEITPQLKTSETKKSLLSGREKKKMEIKNTDDAKVKTESESANRDSEIFDDEGYEKF